MRRRTILRRTILALGWLTAMLLVGATQRMQTAEVTGTVTTVDVQKRELVVGDMHGRNWLFRLSKMARITINNRPGQLAELGPGDSVRVIYQGEGKQSMATEIHAMQM